MCLAIVEAKLDTSGTNNFQTRCSSEAEVTKTVADFQNDEACLKITIYRPSKTLEKKTVWSGE